MFCPKCGCVLDDKMIICRECGYRIPRKMVPELSEDDTDASVKPRMTPGVKKQLGARAVGIAASLVVVCSFMMSWGGYASLDGTVHLLTSGDFLDLGWNGDMAPFRYVPTLIPVLGIVTAAVFVLGSKGWPGVLGVAAGFSGILITAAFSIQLSSVYMTSGYAVYLDLVLCVIIAFTGYYCVTHRNRPV